ncbi:MAG TPA: hypothetical protein VJ992_10450 [Gemmatimonadales bacterium]|jgi:hypothetical protein|nr:hypothetical protein [Gemmatimonadales bacterium]
MTDAEGRAVRRERLRFVDFDFDRLANGRCRARVTLEWSPGEPMVGDAEGLGSDAGALRCAAEATLDAIEHAVDGRVEFELLGVKAVRAFDAMVLIVSLSSRTAGEHHRLVGSYLAEEDSPRGAAIAVLNATNRLLGNIFSRDAA